MVHVQQEGIGHVHFQFPQVVEGLLQACICLCAQGHGAVVQGVGVDIGHQVACACVGVGLLLGKGFERKVHLTHVGNFTRLGGEVVAHESVEVHHIGCLAKCLFHGPPVGVVKLRLQLGLQPHQDVVANEVGLAELQPRGVHALKDQLGVVL